MYLSRITLNKGRRETRHLLSSAQRVHAAVMCCFPPADIKFGSDGQVVDRVLWRLDFEGDQPRLYIVSKDKPSFTHLQEQAGWPEHKTWETADYSRLLDKLAVGQKFRFRLTANPVHVATVGGKKKRLAHVTVAQQLQWLVDRQEHLGLQFLTVESADGEASEPLASVTRRESLKFRRGKSLVTISRVTFDGVAEVADVDALKNVLVNGIGHAKGYGCGLLTLARFE